MDDLITGDTNVEKMKHLKETAIDIFQKADFELHKWHSNVPELKSGVKPSNKSDQSFAKQQLGVGNDETKLLGLQWDKAEDTITVNFPKCEEAPTKRSVLRTMVRVYDSLGMVAPVTLVSKEICREICDRKLSWDEELPPDLKKRWRKWMNNLTNGISMTWGGQFERLIGSVKKSLFKVIGEAKLKFSEEEVTLDIEVALNNRPLSSVEDDLQSVVWWRGGWGTGGHGPQ